MKRKRIFISWYDGFLLPAAMVFVKELEKRGFEINFSPKSPDTNEYDPKWKDWYEKGLHETISQSDIFIAIIAKPYESSTWMAQEYQEALSQQSRDLKPLLFHFFAEPVDLPIGFNQYMSKSTLLESEKGKYLQIIDAW